MATITAALVTNPDRVSVSLSGWSTDGNVAVYRIHPDGSRWLVRGAAGGSYSVSVSGGVGAVLDDEAPYMLPVTYEALDGTVVAAGSVTIPLDTAYLTVPGLPSYRMPVTLLGKPGAGRERPGTVMAPRGRRNRVRISDALKGRSFGVRLRTYTFADADLLETLVERGATLLLRMPGTRWPWTYVSVSSLSSEPVVHYRPQSGSGPDDVAAWEEWTLACEESDSPVGGIYGDPAASWDALEADGKTWDQLEAAGVTWDDLEIGAW